MVAGLEEVTEGEVLIDGENIYAPTVDVTDIRKKTGLLAQRPYPLPMSIYENVSYGMYIHQMKKDKREYKEAVRHYLELAGLWEEVKKRMHDPATSLSIGQQQRLCLARVLALEPEVILMDEPMSGLDPLSTAKIEDSMQQLKQLYTIVIAPHNIQQAARVADNAAFFLQGRLIEEGAGKQLFITPRDKRTEDYIMGRFG